MTWCVSCVRLRLAGLFFTAVRVRAAGFFLLLSSPGVSSSSSPPACPDSPVPPDVSSSSSSAEVPPKGRCSVSAAGRFFTSCFVAGFFLVSWLSSSSAFSCDDEVSEAATRPGIAWPAGPPSTDKSKAIHIINCKLTIFWYFLGTQNLNDIPKSLPHPLVPPMHFLQAARPVQPRKAAPVW